MLNISYFYIIRFFGLLITALYIYKRILNITDVPKWKTVCAVLFSLIASVPMSYLPPFYELIFLGSFLLFVCITARMQLSLMVTAVIISTGMSLGIEVVPLTLFALLTNVNMDIYPVTLQWEEQSLMVIFQIVVSAVSLLLIYLFFRLKRLKKGFVFLENKKARLVGIILSILIMFGRSITGFISAFSPIYVLYVINICMVGLHLWWRYQTTMLYRQRLQERDIVQYITEIEEKDQQIKELSESNESLSKTVHRDNKLIPAMYDAVNRLLSNANGSEGGIEAKGRSILSELEEIMKERKNIIMEIQREYKALPSTGIERIDAIINYMFSKATKKDIEFDFIVVGNVKDIIVNNISKQKLETLLADLLENAIIATSDSDYKRIQVTMGMVEDCLELCIQDSGIPFEAETLADLGKKRVTTHASTGGSGIGYIAIFEILNDINASIEISEQPTKQYCYTKYIKIRFDGNKKRVYNDREK